MTAVTTEPGPEAVRAPAPLGAGLRARPAATIYDVAKLAGVAPSTVSRALGKPGRINIKTQRKVEAAASELNYRINPMARSLPTGQTSTLGMLVADFTNPMFFEVVRGAERAAASHGYTLILSESQESAEREASTADRLLPSVDGVILLTTRLADDRIRELAERKPLVVINREVIGVSSLVPQLEPGIDEALDRLHHFGHRSIAFLAGPTRAWMSRARWELLFEGALRRGMRIVEVPCDAPTIDGGRAALPRVQASGVSAVVAYNDLTAIGLMKAFQEGGGVVPDELSIVGFDDIFGSDFTSPPLTTIKTPLGVLGERAVLALLGVDAPADDDESSGADDDESSADSEFAPRPRTRLVFRGSVGSAPSL